MEDKPIYYDTERKQMYWIEWSNTGNSGIPTRHYIEEDSRIGQRVSKILQDIRTQALEAGLEIVEMHRGQLCRVRMVPDKNPDGVGGTHVMQIRPMCAWTPGHME